MSHSETDLLRHMLDETEYLLGRSQHIDKHDFLADDTLRRAFARSIEIIGEAAKGVPRSFRDKYPELPWQAIAGMRDRLIHAYFAVDYELVWDVVRNKLPTLREQIKVILDTEQT